MLKTTPFGMMMPGREYQAQPSRFGFNGKENDHDVKGFGNQQDYGMRIYDTRIGKFLSVDPIAIYYPELTPYQFASNGPIQYIDLDGLEAALPAYAKGADYDPERPAWIREQKTSKQNQQLARNMLLTVPIATAIVVDIYATRGQGTAFFLASQGAGAFEHNRASTEEGRQAQDKRSKDALANTFITAGTGLMFNRLGFITNEVKQFASQRLYNFGAKALGEMGEAAMARHYGTVKPGGKGSSLSTTIGPRKPDGIPPGFTVGTTDKLYEAKVGFQNYSGDIVDQVAKDAEILAQGQITRITWVFYRSPTTGKVGASDELLKELKKAGIKTEIAGDIPQDIINKAVIKYGATIK